MRGAALTLLLVGPALAGCFGASIEPVSSPPAAAALFRYLCPGEADEGTPCLAQLPRGDAMLQQPYVAVHPRDPQIIAVGVHYVKIAERVPAVLLEGAPQTRLAVYVSEDNGASWRETFAPVPTMSLGPADYANQGDAAMLFDPEGRLHLTALAAKRGPPVDDSNDRPTRAYYVRSDDLGRTWGEPMWLGTDEVGHDRNWIVRDPASGALYVVWQDGSSDLPDRTVFVAWSIDSGVSWLNQEPAQRARCYRAGMPMVLDGGLRFACTRHEEGESEALQLYSFDASGGAVALLAEFAVGEVAAFPFLTPLSGGPLAMHYDNCVFARVPPDPPNPCLLDSPLARSHDDGLTWEPAGSARGFSPAEWSRARISFSASDEFGGQHLLVRYERDEPQPATPADPTGRVFTPLTIELRHLVLDGSGAILHNVRLETWTSEAGRIDEWIPGLDDEGSQQAGSQGGHPRCGGMSCFYGLAWAGDRGVLAFSHDGAVQFALVTRDGAPLTGVPPVVSSASRDDDRSCGYESQLTASLGARASRGCS